MKMTKMTKTEYYGSLKSNAQIITDRSKAPKGFVLGEVGKGVGFGNKIAFTQQYREDERSAEKE